MNLKRIGNVIFIVCTLAVAAWVVASPTPVPTPVMVFMITLCVVGLILIFWPLVRRRSR
ncbi:hypothetical protein ACWDR1_32070 [Streptosporangium sandarakinum]